MSVPIDYEDNDYELILADMKRNYFVKINISIF